MSTHTLAAHEPTRAEALAASGGPTPPTTTSTGPLPPAAPASVPPSGRFAPAPRKAISPELAALQTQVEAMAERLGYLCDDVWAEACMVNADAVALRGVLLDLAGAELRIRQAAERAGLTLTIDTAAPELKPLPGGRRCRRATREPAAAADVTDATDSDPDAEADADAAFGRGWRSAE